MSRIGDDPRNREALRNPRRSQEQRKGNGLPARLDDRFVFKTFRVEDWAQKRRLYFDAPRELADLLRQSRKLSATALRRVFNAYAPFARRLAKERTYWAEAQERFGHFYVTTVVRQTRRRVIPELIQDIFDRHRELALSHPDEMLGLFRYVTYLLCYYGDREERGD